MADRDTLGGDQLSAPDQKFKCKACGVNVPESILHWDEKKLHFYHLAIYYMMYEEPVVKCGPVEKPLLEGK